MDAIDPASLPADAQAGADPASSVALLDMASGARVPCTAGWDAFAHVLTVAPEDPLGSGKTYAAIVTAAVHSTSGHALAASSGFAAIRDGKRATPAAQLYGGAIDAAVAAGIAKSHIVGATVFTTATTHKKLRAIRDALVAGTYGPAPTLITTNLSAPLDYVRFGASAHTGWTATLDEFFGTSTKKDAGGQDLTGFPGGPDPTSTAIGHDAVGAVLTAAFVSPEFRRPFNSTADPSDGTIAYDASGHAMPYNANQQIPVSIALPLAAPPSTGYPVVIFQHGLGADRSQAAAVLNQLARAGIATIAIDAPWHGMRQPGASDTVSAGKGTYMGPDGFADGSNNLALVAMVAQTRNWIAADDNYFQAALDLVQLRRLVANIDLSPLAAQYGNVAPTLDNTKVGLLGWSMGGAISAIFAGIEPRTSVNPVVLDAPAVALAKQFVDSPVYDAQTTLIAAQAQIPVDSLNAHEYAAVINILLGVMDRSDSGAFAADSDHDLWLVHAADDESVMSRWVFGLARAYGATQLTPTLSAVPRLTQGGSTLSGGSRVVGFFEASPGGHAFMTYRYNQMNFAPPYPRPAEPRFVNVAHPFNIRAPVVGTQLAAIHFFQTTWAGAPELKIDDPAFVGLVPVADTDDDGYCDADEVAANTDPFDPTSHPTTTPQCVRVVGF